MPRFSLTLCCPIYSSSRRGLRLSSNCCSSWPVTSPDSARSWLISVLPYLVLANSEVYHNLRFWRIAVCQARRALYNQISGIVGTERHQVHLVSKARPQEV